MKFSSSIIIAVATLFTATDACRCMTGVGNDVEATVACCKEADGKPSGNNCPAGEIADTLDIFSKCCRQYRARSDCRCPGCDAAEL